MLATKSSGFLANSSSLGFASGNVWVGEDAIGADAIGAGEIGAGWVGVAGWEAFWVSAAELGRRPATG